MPRSGGEFRQVKSLLVSLLAATSVLAGLPFQTGGSTGHGGCGEQCECPAPEAADAEEQEPLSCCSSEEEEPSGPIWVPACGCGAHAPGGTCLLGDSFRCPPHNGLDFQAAQKESGEFEAWLAPAVSRRPLPEPPPPRA